MRLRRGGLVLGALGVVCFACVFGAWSVPELFVVPLSGPSDWQPVPIAGLETECSAVAGSVPFTLCVHRTAESTSRDLGRHFFRSEAAWQRHDPVRLAAAASPEQTPELYLLCGRRDDWGCMEGSLALVEAARARNLALEWHPRDGGHCDVDVPSLARFLAPRGPARSPDFSR